MTTKASLKIAGAAALLLGMAPLTLAQSATAPANQSSSRQSSTMMASGQTMKNCQTQHCRMMHGRDLSKSQVKQVQRALDQHGYQVKVDGMWGQNSRQAVNKFQRKNDLKVTGHPDKKTRQALGLPW